MASGEVQVPKFARYEYDLSDTSSYLTHTSSGVWNMEEDEILDQLTDQSFKKRAEILDHLLVVAKRNGGRLPYTDMYPIFQGFGLALSDTNWDVRLKCTRLINELLPQFDDNIDSCMNIIIKKIIYNFGDSKISVRRATIQTLHVYLKHSKDVKVVLDAIVVHGLDHEEARVRKEVTVSLPMILTPDFFQEDFFGITKSLANKLFETPSQENLKDCALMSLDAVKKLVGEHEFQSYLQRLSAPLRRYYIHLQNPIEDINDSELSTNPYDNVTPRHHPFSKQESRKSNHIWQQKSSTIDPDLEFGIIPSHILDQVNNKDDFRSRSKGIEELKNIVSELTSREVTEDLLPTMLPFISFLNHLLDDSNFKIIIVTLEIYGLLVEKLGQNVKSFLRQLSAALVKRMVDNKIVVRQMVMQVATKMMQSYTPKPVLTVICENLQHKNSRVRQETLNIVIAATLMFPSYDFDLAELSRFVGPTLVDPKRQVRQAALECFAVLASAMGAGRLQPLVSAVDKVELMQEGDGVMAAVQARLARRQLPRVGSNGLIEYATQIPSSSNRIHTSAIQGADIEWIQLVSGSATTSARSRSDAMELESVTSSARSTPAGLTDPSPRRFLSAGRGRNKLPWEEEQEDRVKTYETLPASAPAPGVRNGTGDSPPLKAHQTWTTDEGFSQNEAKKPLKSKRTTHTGVPTQEENADNLYKPHLNRIKRQQQQNPSSSRLANTLVNLDIDDTSDREYRDEMVSSWAENTPRSHRKVLGPISAVRDQEEYPIPLKPALARGSASHQRRVPPINPSSSRYTTPREDDVDSAYAPSLESYTFDNENSEMLNSLKQIRNSASKKKAAKIFKHLEREDGQPNPYSRSPSPPYSDFMGSGVFSSSSSSYHDDESDVTNGDSSRKKGKKIESPFESKPKLARGDSFGKKKPLDYTDADDVKAYSQLESRNDYNPSSGVTFPDNRNPDVKIIGRGYSDENKSSPALSKAARDRRKLTKGSLLSPLGMSSPHLTGALELDDDQVPAKEISIFGKGMFDTTGSEHSSSLSTSPDKLDRKTTYSDHKDIPSGVVCVGVKQNLTERRGSSDEAGIYDDYSDEYQPSIGNITRTRDKSISKQQSNAEEIDIKNKERKQQEKEERVRLERERQQERLRKLSSRNNLELQDLAVEGNTSSSQIKSSPSKPPLAASPRKRERVKQHSSNSSPPLSSSLRTPIDSDNPEDWTPYRDPDAALRTAQKNMANEEWDVKCVGINSMRRLTIHNSEVIGQQLHPVVLSVINEVKNLRSQVSRLAVMCLGDMFASLKKNMDSELEITANVLLAKNGEANVFIRDEIFKALACMVDYVTQQRCLLALISGGASHKNQAVRKTTAIFLSDLVDKMGPGRILSGIKDVTDRVLLTISKFVIDGSPETRYHGRKMLFMLMFHHDFDRMLAKHLPAPSLSNVKEIVENLKIKGLGDMPSEAPSARSRRSGQGSRSGSSTRGGSAGSNGEGVMTPSSTRRTTVRTDDQMMEEIKLMTSQMSANDWRERHAGIVKLQEMCECQSEIVGANITRICDKFLTRLQDSNSKVNLLALQVMYEMTPILSNSPIGIINMAVLNLVPNLNSKNKEIYGTAKEVLDKMIKELDGSLLVQPFANQAQNANARSKPEMVEKVAVLVAKVYQKKQKQVVLHVLPLLWHLLGAGTSSGAIQGGSGNLRAATTTLVHALYSQMGTGLFDKAGADSAVTQRHMQQLQDMME